MKRDSGSHKPASTHTRAPQYTVKIAGHSYVSLEREYMDLAHRYSRLYVPTDFSRSISLWTQVGALILLCTACHLIASASCSSIYIRTAMAATLL